MMERWGGNAREVRYQVCPNCGFRLLYVLPPGREGAVAVMYCPVCEFRRDERGIQPGRALSEEEKLAALRRWLERQGLSERTLRLFYHLELYHFFEPGERWGEA